MTTNMQRSGLLLPFAIMLLLVGCAGMPDAPSPVLSELAPTGTLRVAINLGNPVLAQRDSVTGELRGMSVELAKEFSREAKRPLKFIAYESAGEVVAALKNQAWDMAFLAIDPKRAESISFTEPYLSIDGVFLVRKESPIRNLSDVDAAGVRIAVGAGSAYDLHLSRTLKSAQLVRAPSSRVVVDIFLRQDLDVAAGVRQQIARDADRLPGLRLLEGRFMTINQAVAIPAGRPQAAQLAGEFVSTQLRNGAIARLIEQFDASR